MNIKGLLACSCWTAPLSPSTAELRDASSFEVLLYSVVYIFSGVTHDEVKAPVWAKFGMRLRQLNAARVPSDRVRQPGIVACVWMRIILS